MTLHEAIELFKDHQKDNAKEKTRESYGYLFRNLETLLEDGALDAIVTSGPLPIPAYSDRRTSQIDGPSPLRPAQVLLQLRHRGNPRVDDQSLQ